MVLDGELTTACADVFPAAFAGLFPA
jgi:hypothetical protein